MSKKKAAASKESMALALDGDMTIQRIAEIKTQLVETLNGTDSLVLNLKKVTRVDLTFLQLLCSAHRTAHQARKTLELAEVPELVDIAVTTAGFVRENMACGQECSEICLWKES
jgi:ABC-type transporter Mla MlaB component